MDINYNKYLPKKDDIKLKDDPEPVLKPIKYKRCKPQPHSYWSNNAMEQALNRITVR
jgi:hypothetical protein